MQQPGGWSTTKPATPEIQELCGMIRKPLEKKYRKFTKYVATEYRQQVVAGMNYLVKIEVDNGEYVHVEIFKPLPPVNKLRFDGYEPNHKKDDPLIPFDRQV
ncbi:cystatin-A-like [Littorina saxatilis]|uniref:cystatin-A-like n=1 Tax=Littorina saxatilis TaxID=31220 RepID=UPI0038B5000A